MISPAIPLPFMGVIFLLFLLSVSVFIPCFAFVRKAKQRMRVPLFYVWLAVLGVWFFFWTGSIKDVLPSTTAFLNGEELSTNLGEKDYCYLTPFWNDFRIVPLEGKGKIRSSDDITNVLYSFNVPQENVKQIAKSDFVYANGGLPDYLEKELAFIFQLFSWDDGHYVQNAQKEVARLRDSLGIQLDVTLISEASGITF